MTDKEYIDEIAKGNDKIVEVLYRNYRKKFETYFSKNYKFSHAEEIVDIYQDSWTAVLTNIRTERKKAEKLTSEKLDWKLETYLFQIGKYTCLARNRKENKKAENKGYGRDSQMLPTVLNDGKKKLNSREFDYEELDLDNLDTTAIKRDECALQAIRNVGEPCSSILSKFYIEKKSGEEIALEMKYKDADSIKTQKYKCMQKVKSLVETQLKKLNLL